MTAEQWLRENAADAPGALLATMLEAVGGSAAASIPERLAGGALSLYERVVAGEGGRADALPLLAADALFTHAFQAMAETDAPALMTFVEGWVASDALARLIS